MRVKPKTGVKHKVTTKSRAVIVLAVVALAIVVAAAMLPNHANDKLRSAINEMKVEVKSFGLLNTLESPDRSVYRMVLTFTNDSTIPVKYTAGSLVMRFSPSHQIGANATDEGTLRPGESVELTRDFTMLATVVADLRRVRELAARGTLNTELDLKWLLWSLDRAAEFEVKHAIYFD